MFQNPIHSTKNKKNFGINNNTEQKPAKNDVYIKEFYTELIKNLSIGNPDFIKGSYLAYNNFLDRRLIDPIPEFTQLIEVIKQNKKGNIQYVNLRNSVNATAYQKLQKLA